MQIVYTIFFNKEKNLCDLSGKCVGTFLAQIENIASLDNCLRECQNFEGIDSNEDGTVDFTCNWVTYNSALQTCELLDGCEVVNESCVTCTSSNVKCAIRDTKGKKTLL